MENLLWQAQANMDELEAQVVRQQEEEEVALREADALKEKEDLHREEHKKNHSKFLPIPNCPVPQIAPVITTHVVNIPIYSLSSLLFIVSITFLISF